MVIWLTLICTCICKEPTYARFNQAAEQCITLEAMPAGVYTRRIEKDEFLLRVIDCPHLITADTLDTAALDELTKLPATSRIDVVLYVDRLDVFRVQPADRQVRATRPMPLFLLT